MQGKKKTGSLFLTPPLPLSAADIQLCFPLLSYCFVQLLRAGEAAVRKLQIPEVSAYTRLWITLVLDPVLSQ